VGAALCENLYQEVTAILASPLFLELEYPRTVLPDMAMQNMSSISAQTEV